MGASELCTYAFNDILILQHKNPSSEVDLEDHPLPGCALQYEHKQSIRLEFWWTSFWKQPCRLNFPKSKQVYSLC